jgi:O-antigen/teichoic acid export membrane protein
VRQNLLNRLEALKTSEFGNVLYHAKHYLTGDVAIKALGLISMPVFTRLMNREDYGIVAVYTATYGLLSSLTTLNAADGISRYYFEKDKSDFGSFISSAVQLILLIQIPFLAVLIIFKETIMGWMGLPPTLVYLMIVSLLYGVSYKIFQQILISHKLSKKFVKVRIFQSYSSFGLSTIFLLTISGLQYVLRIAGFVIIQFVVGVWMFIQNASFIVWTKIQWKHVRYSLVYALPRLPYVLSGVILSQFDRIMLSSKLGPADAGIYSAAYNVGGLSFLIIGALTPALIPNFYKLMNEGKYNVVDKLNRNIAWLIAFGGIGLMIFGGFVLKILADEKFHSGATLVPIIVLGYMFYGVAGVYNRYIGFYKITILQSIAALTSGTLNIILNNLWIPQYGGMGAAYTTAISYALLALLTWIFIRLAAKGHVTGIKYIILPLILAIGTFWAIQFWF